MRSSIIICALFASLLSVNTFADEINIVTEEYPPYEYIENGQWVGLNVDIVREVCKRVGDTLVFESYPWKRCIKMMQEGTAEGIMSLIKTPERAKFISFPAFNLSNEKNVIFSHKGSGIKINSLDDLKGKFLGVQKKYSYGERFDNYQGLDKEYCDSLENLLKKYEKGRMELIIGNEAVIMYMNKQMGLKPVEVVYAVSEDSLNIGFFSVYP